MMHISDQQPIDKYIVDIDCVNDLDNENQNHTYNLSDDDMAFIINNSINIITNSIVVSKNEKNNFYLSAYKKLHMRK